MDVLDQKDGQACLVFTFIDNFTLTCENKYEVLDFVGLFWPSLAIMAFHKFLKQKLAFVDKKSSIIGLFQ